MVELLDAVSRGVDHVSKVPNYILLKTNDIDEYLAPRYTHLLTLIL